MRRRSEPTPADLLTGIAGDLNRLVDIYGRTLADLEQRLAAAEKKSRNLRNRAPIRELNQRLQDVEIRLYHLARQSERRPPAPSSGTRADR